MSPRMDVSLQDLIYASQIYNIREFPYWICLRGWRPKDRAPVGLGPLSGAGIHFEPILPLPVLSPFLNRPTGGESYELGNQLAE